jgi:hypothetical protein
VSPADQALLDLAAGLALVLWPVPVSAGPAEVSFAFAAENVVTNYSSLVLVPLAMLHVASAACHCSHVGCRVAGLTRRHDRAVLGLGVVVLISTASVSIAEYSL